MAARALQHEWIIMTCYWPRDLDIFYISYDEPNREDNWARVLEIIPHAKRMHGIKGFEAAHKACALASGTDRFLTIDGDNWALDEGFDTQLDDTNMEDVVFSFKSRNAINGLEYGNGGLKCWRKHTLLASNTHESSDSTDFCWALRYYQVDVLGSISVNNASDYQAWRAGYREGVKMSYVDGKPMRHPRTDMDSIWYGNRSKLNVWMSIGRDCAHGEWAMLGARQGFYELYSGIINNTVINDYDWFTHRWQDMAATNLTDSLPLYGRLLRDEFGLYVPEMDRAHSAWFKSTYINPPRKGLML
jgi:hypothetical protein